MTPTTEDLAEADCRFSTDKVGGPAMTAFKQEARWRQHLWAKGKGVRQFGTHPGPRPAPGETRRQIVNGTKLLEDDAKAGTNFLTDAIHDLAEDRIKQKQPHETLDAQRLRRDLLSSMPMAFNLFGEAAARENVVSRDRLAELFGVAPGAPSEIVFEWSPGRRDARYTRDRTAFDVALLIGGPGPRTAVGIETKYHEHSVREPSPKAKSRAAHEQQTSFLVDKANESGVFASGWEDHVLDTDLRQIWRDHVLALSMRAATDEWTPSTKYVLLYPSGNVSFASAAERYSALLTPDDDSFAAFTVEDVLDAAFAHGAATKGAFRERYLQWMQDRG